MRFEPSHDDTARRSGLSVGSTSPVAAASVMLDAPAQRPVLLRHLACRRCKGLERIHDERAAAGRHPADDPPDLRTAAPADLGHQLAPGVGQRDLDDPAIIAAATPCDQPLAHQPIAHARRRRAIDGQRVGQIGEPEWSAGGQLDEDPVLATSARLAPRTASTSSSLLAAARLCSLLATTPCMIL